MFAWRPGENSTTANWTGSTSYTVIYVYGDEGSPGDASGVREPLAPKPTAPAGAIALEVG